MTLEEIYGAPAKALPIREDDQEHATVFTVGSVPKPPAELVTDGVTLFRGRMIYSTAVLVDRAYLFAWPVRYQQLGLLCLGVLFHQDVDSVDIHLTDPRTELRTIRIRYEWPRPDRYSSEYSPYPTTYNVAPVALQHWIRAYEQDLLVFDADSRPSMTLTNVAEDWDYGTHEPKTHLVGFSEDQGGYGLATIAELFLNLGSPQQRPQFELEMPGALGPEGGVAHLSAELRVHLPEDPQFAIDGPEALSSGAGRPAPNRRSGAGGGCSDNVL